MASQQISRHSPPGGRLGFAENNLEKVLSFCTDDITWTMVGDTTKKGKDVIRKWMASMDPQPPRLTIQQTIAEGDSVVARGDMDMPEKKNGGRSPIPSAISTGSLVGTRSPS